VYAGKFSTEGRWWLLHLHVSCVQHVNRLRRSAKPVFKSHDTIEEFNVDSKAEYSALSSTRSQKKIPKKRNKTNKRQCPLTSVRVQDPWRQSGRNKTDYGGKDLWKRRDLGLEWKVEGVIHESRLVSDRRFIVTTESTADDVTLSRNTTVTLLHVSMSSVTLAVGINIHIHSTDSIGVDWEYVYWHQGTSWRVGCQGQRLRGSEGG